MSILKRFRLTTISSKLKMVKYIKKYSDSKLGENMNTKKVIILSFLLVALLTVSSTSVKTSAELSSVSSDVTTLDSPKFSGKSAVGLSYDSTSSVGDSENFKYDLEEGREYNVFVYGPFMGTNTDYDLELYEPGEGDPLIKTTKAAGKLELINFKAAETGDYEVKVRNDKDDSGGEEISYVFLAEVIRPGSSAEVLIEHRETINTYYAFWFDASGYTGEEVSLKLVTPEEVDMYQMRLYPFIDEEEGEENIYDIIESSSEYALLTEDAGQAGEDLEISFTPDDYETTDNVYIISLIGEKGDGDCTFRISVESEEQGNETTTEEPTVQPLCLGTLTVSAFTVITLIAVGIKGRKHREET